MKRFLSLGLGIAILAMAGCTSATAQQTSPPPSNYKKVSTLV